MRRFVTVGVFSVAAVLLYGACSDDGGDGPIGTGGSGASGGAAGSGTGGTGAVGGDAGTGNIAGQGGTAGTAGVGGSAGSAGSAGTAGSGGTDPDAGDGGVDSDGGLGDGGLGDASLPPPCTGCLELRAPNLNNTDSRSAYFQLFFAADDLSDTVVTFHLRSLALDPSNQTTIQTFATSSPDGNAFSQGNGASVPNNASTFPNDNFITVSLDMAAADTTNGFDKTTVVAYGIQIFAGDTYAGPAPVLLLDSITFAGSAGLSTLDFTDNEQGFAVQTGLSAAGTQIIHH